MQKNSLLQLCDRHTKMDIKQMDQQRTIMCLQEDDCFIINFIINNDRLSLLLCFTCEKQPPTAVSTDCLPLLNFHWIGQFSLVGSMSVVLFVPIARNRRLGPKNSIFKLLVKEFIANIGIPLDVFFLCFYRFNDFFLRFVFFIIFG